MDPHSIILITGVSHELTMQGRGEKRTRGYLVLLQRVDGRYLYRHFRSSSQLRRFVSCVFVPAGRYQLEDRQRSLTATPTRELIKKKSCIHCTQTPALLRRLSSEHTFKRRKRNEAKSAFPAGQYACACTRPLGPPVQGRLHFPSQPFQLPHPKSPRTFDGSFLPPSRSNQGLHIRPPTTPPKPSTQHGVPVPSHHRPKQNRTHPASGPPTPNPTPTPASSRRRPAAMAFRLSNNLIGVLNFVTFLLSVPILGAGIWLGHRADGTECERYLSAPVIALGAFLLAVSLAGLVGACCRVTWLLWAYLLAMFVLILVLFCFTVFAFVVTNRGAGEAVSGRGYKEYRLGDYSNWLQKRVENTRNWDRIRSCLQDSKVCKSLQDKNETVAQFMSSSLSPIEVIINYLSFTSKPYVLIRMSAIHRYIHRLKIFFTCRFCYFCSG
jgi:hypothetical protein